MIPRGKTGWTSVIREVKKESKRENQNKTLAGLKNIQLQGGNFITSPNRYEALFNINVQLLQQLDFKTSES